MRHFTPYSRLKRIIAQRFRLACCCLSISAAFGGNAFALHERPWAQALPQAEMQVRATLPYGDGGDVVALPDGSFVVRLAAYGTSSNLFHVDRFGNLHSLPRLSMDRASSTAGSDAIHASAITMGDDGGIWFIGSANEGKPTLYQVETHDLKIVRRVSLPAQLVLPRSSFADIAVHLPWIYLADEGQPALCVLNLQNGRAQRFYDGDPVMKGHNPRIIDGQIVQNGGENVSRGNLAMLAVQNDGMALYAQSPSGPLYKFDTRLLTDPSITPIEREEGMTNWRGTPTLGGIAVSATNTLYFTDRSKGRLLSFDSGRHPFILVSDPRLTQARKPFVVDDTLLYVLAGRDILQITRPHP